MARAGRDVRFRSHQGPCWPCSWQAPEWGCFEKEQELFHQMRKVLKLGFLPACNQTEPFLKISTASHPRHERVPRSWGLRAEPPRAGEAWAGISGGRRRPSDGMASPKPPVPSPPLLPARPLPVLPGSVVSAWRVSFRAGELRGPLGCARLPFAVTSRYLLDGK